MFSKRSGKLKTAVAVALFGSYWHLFAELNTWDYGRWVVLDTLFNTEAIHEKQGTEHVPLFAWEVESAVNRTCQPPNGIPTYCCLGSVSSGGGVSFTKKLCSRGMQPYNKVQNMSLHFLEQHALDARQQQCDVCQIFDYLLQYNLTLSFQGDSLMRQNFVGLECEFGRRGYNVSTATTKKKNPDPRWKYGLGSTTILTIEKQNMSAAIYFYAIYRPVEDMLEIAEIVRNSDILVFDHGLHYLPKFSDMLVNHTSSMLETARENGLKLLFWRETSAQHFNESGGHYSKRSKGNGCLPLHGDGGFRHSLILQASNISGYSVSNASHRAHSHRTNSPSNHLMVLPFYELTSQLHDLHPHDGDCAHFCSTPYLWLPLWRTLRLAMDQFRTT